MMLARRLFSANSNTETLSQLIPQLVRVTAILLLFGLGWVGACTQTVLCKLTIELSSAQVVNIRYSKAAYLQFEIS